MKSVAQSIMTREESAAEDHRARPHDRIFTNSIYDILLGRVEYIPYNRRCVPVVTSDCNEVAL